MDYNRDDGRANQGFQAEDVMNMTTQNGNNQFPGHTDGVSTTSLPVGDEHVIPEKSPQLISEQKNGRPPGSGTKDGHVVMQETYPWRETNDRHHTATVDGHVITSKEFLGDEDTESSHKPPPSYQEHDQDLVLEKREFDPTTASCFSRGIMFVQTEICRVYETHKNLMWRCVGLMILAAFLAYLGYAMYFRFGDEGSLRLLVCTIIGLLILAWNRWKRLTRPAQRSLTNFLGNAKYNRVRRIIRWVLYVLNSVVTVTVIVVLVALDSPRNLLSLAGLAAFVVLYFVTSYNPAMVNWHPVFWGLALQFYFALIILKTRAGYEAFKWLGDRFTEFLDYANTGASFVFGDVVTVHTTDGKSFDIMGAYNLHYFAFSIMPIITFFSTAIAILEYLGVMTALTRVVGSFLSFCLGTTPAESLNAAGNIFASMTECPFMIKPFLRKMTSSELHAVMVGGFSSIAGGVMGVYISFGVPADHLLSASVMAAPAALAISKLTYPEVEVPIIGAEDYQTPEEVTEGNLIEAACSGAIASAKIIAAVLVNVIAFLSLLKFFNATLTWFGDRVGVDNLSFELICSYVLYPIALFMGTEPDDCRQMAELIGIKTFTNEFIAYQKLSVLINNRKVYNGYVAQYGEGFTHTAGDDLVLDLRNNTRLVKGIMSHRSEVIATYALCNFSNFGSMGILLGTLSALAPCRKPTMARLIGRAMIAGNGACFFTACIAGLFFQEFD